MTCKHASSRRGLPRSLRAVPLNNGERRVPVQHTESHAVNKEVNCILHIVVEDLRDQTVHHRNSSHIRCQIRLCSRDSTSRVNCSFHAVPTKARSQWGVPSEPTSRRPDDSAR